jgi:methenyltetrahydrofolate cyclohydrolase
MLETQTISAYLQELASGQPTPGGGAAAALTGAQGVALLAMVCNLTIGKKSFSSVEEEIRSILEILDMNRQNLLKLADKDIEAFQLTMKAYKQPKATELESETRNTTIQEALISCSEVPFELFKTCLSMLTLADRLEEIGNPSVLSDVLVGRYLLLASIFSAKVNVDVNLDGIKESCYCTEKRSYMENALSEVRSKYQYLVSQG